MPDLIYGEQPVLQRNERSHCLVPGFLKGPRRSSRASCPVKLLQSPQNGKLSTGASRASPPVNLRVVQREGEAPAEPHKTRLRRPQPRLAGRLALPGRPQPAYSAVAMH